MTATDELRALLDERGVEYKDRDTFGNHVFHWGEPLHGAIYIDGAEWTELVVDNASPAQAIAATLGRGECRKVYLVETSDDLIDNWYPVAVYLHRESAEDCAEALRKEDDGIRQFARVSELRVVDG